MGNANVTTSFPDNSRVAPPEGQSGSCFTCTRAQAFTPVPGGLDVVCEWKGPWERIVAGCNRWERTDQPIASPMPGLKDPAPLVWVGKGAKRRWK